MRTTANLIYVGRRENAYDFTGGDGERIKGVKRTAYFTDPENGYNVHEIDVRENMADAYGTLEFGKGYAVSSEPVARNNRVIYRLVDVYPLD